MFTKPLTRAPRYVLIKSFFLAIGSNFLYDLSKTFLKKGYEVKLQFKTASLIWREKKPYFLLFLFPCRNFPIASPGGNSPEKMDHLQRWSPLTGRSPTKIGCSIFKHFRLLRNTQNFERNVNVFLSKLAIVNQTEYNQYELKECDSLSHVLNV